MKRKRKEEKRTRGDEGLERSGELGLEEDLVKELEGVGGSSQVNLGLLRGKDLLSSDVLGCLCLFVCF